MLSEVFDRHPGLKVMMTEVRGDWIPATSVVSMRSTRSTKLTFPARRPSEYWPTNCMAGLSFMKKSEVEMRDEIGVDTINFGRDYPHGRYLAEPLDYLKPCSRECPRSTSARCSVRTPSVSSA
jgi:predicted TIM-barrel fold metal-dependent hydrolase